MQISGNACVLHIEKNIKNTKKYTGFSSGKVPTDDCSADLFLGDSAFPLCCSKYRTRSRNFTTTLFLHKE